MRILTFTFAIPKLALFWINFFTASMFPFVAAALMGERSLCGINVLIASRPISDSIHLTCPLDVDFGASRMWELSRAVCIWEYPIISYQFCAKPTGSPVQYPPNLPWDCHWKQLLYGLYILQNGLYWRTTTSMSTFTTSMTSLRII